MRRTLVLSLCLMLATTALAGCTMLGGNEEDDTDPTPDPVTSTPSTTTPATTTPAVTPTPPTATPPLDSSTYQLAVAGAPALAKPNATFNVTLFVNGSITSATQHVGAHFANNDTFSPNASQMLACLHQGGTLPGTFTVGCRMAEEGTWYVWGHAQVNDSGELRNWWTPAPFVVKIRDYVIVASGHPTNPQPSNESFTFQVDVRGKENVTTDHIGAHYWNATEANPTIQNAAGACVHIASGIVGNYTITCAIPNDSLTPKDFFVRGHARLAEGGSTLEWWSDEAKITVLGSLPGSPL